MTNGKAELAMIPVENNIAGRVADMHFLLENVKLMIVAEYYHKIEHCLLKKKNSINNITKVLSHAHALGQCKKNIKQLKLIAVQFMDTAGAAKFVKENDNNELSAIASTLRRKDI